MTFGFYNGNLNYLYVILGRAFRLNGDYECRASRAMILKRAIVWRSQTLGLDRARTDQESDDPSIY